MMPYDTLNISPDADDREVRKAFLELVRKYPPDLAPDRFKLINEAYTLIKDKKARLDYYLFNTETYEKAPADLLINYLRETGRKKPPAFSDMKKILKRCAEK